MLNFISVDSIQLELSRSGIPCLWESGGGMTNTGEAVIIAGPSGEKKKPIHIRKRGHLACGEHALIPVEAGDYIITTYRHRAEYQNDVYKIANVLESKTARKVLIGVFPNTQEPYRELSMEEALEMAKREYGTIIEDTYRTSRIGGSTFHYVDVETFKVVAKLEKLSDIPPFLSAAIEAAEEKTNNYHCRKPIYIA